MCGMYSQPLSASVVEHDRNVTGMMKIELSKQTK